MPFIFDMYEASLSYNPDNPDELQELHMQSFLEGTKRYRDYLNSISDRLPPAAREFATAHWHYDYSDPRSLHDSLLKKVDIRIVRWEVRTCNITVELLGVSRGIYKGLIKLHYRNVHEYLLSHVSELRHDEVQLTEGGLVRHIIRWDHAGYWTIDCEDIAYEWKPYKKRGWRYAV